MGNCKQQLVGPGSWRLKRFENHCLEEQDDLNLQCGCCQLTAWAIPNRINAPDACPLCSTQRGVKNSLEIFRSLRPCLQRHCQNSNEMLSFRIQSRRKGGKVTHESFWGLQYVWGHGTWGDMLWQNWFPARLIPFPSQWFSNFLGITLPSLVREGPIVVMWSPGSCQMPGVKKEGFTNSATQ